jgi:hypothetical protein
MLFWHVHFPMYINFTFHHVILACTFPYVQKLHISSCYFDMYIALYTETSLFIMLFWHVHFPMYSTCMFSHVTFVCKTFVTKWTYKWFLSSMHSLVNLECPVRGLYLPAIFTPMFEQTLDCNTTGLFSVIYDVTMEIIHTASRH